MKKQFPTCVPSVVLPRHPWVEIEFRYETGQTGDRIVSDRWAIRLSLDHLYRVSELRLLPGIEAAVDGQVIWLRGDGLDASLQRTLSPVADDAVFHLTGDGRLTRFGQTVPVERLPELKWQRLVDFLKLVLPVSKIAFSRIPRTRLSLRRSEIVQQEAILVTGWETFRDWALSAPEIRIRACRFAVRRSSIQGRESELADLTRVVIRGNPLPSLMGERYWLAGRVGIPLGYQWFPEVDVPTLEAIVGRSGMAHSGLHHFWIWRPEEDVVDEIQGSELIAVTRASVRATEQVRQDGKESRGRGEDPL